MIRVHFMNPARAHHAARTRGYAVRICCACDLQTGRAAPYKCWTGKAGQIANPTIHVLHPLQFLEAMLLPPFVTTWQAGLNPAGNRPIGTRKIALDLPSRC